MSDEKQACANCRFLREKLVDRPYGDGQKDPHTFCHRRPPVLIANGDSGWPEIFDPENDWCAEWQK